MLGEDNRTPSNGSLRPHQIANNNVYFKLKEVLSWFGVADATLPLTASTRPHVTASGLGDRNTRIWSQFMFQHTPLVHGSIFMSREQSLVKRFPCTGLVK